MTSFVVKFASKKLKNRHFFHKDGKKKVRAYHYDEQKTTIYAAMVTVVGASKCVRDNCFKPTHHSGHRTYYLCASHSPNGAGVNLFC